MNMDTLDGHFDEHKSSYAVAPQKPAHEQEDSRYFLCSLNSFSTSQGSIAGILRPQQNCGDSGKAGLHTTK